VGNRGEEAAEAALHMANWIRSIREDNGKNVRNGNDLKRAEPSGRSRVRLSRATRGQSRPHGTR